MPDDAIAEETARLREEIRVRERRLSELTNVAGMTPQEIAALDPEATRVTREDLGRMTARQIAALDANTVHRALQEEAA
jgi:hypothetical protein